MTNREQYQLRIKIAKKINVHPYRVKFPSEFSDSCLVCVDNKPFGLIDYYKKAVYRYGSIWVEL